MKYLVGIILFFISCSILKCQDNKSTSIELSEFEIDNLFSDSIKNYIGLIYPIYKAYKLLDISGSHFLLLTERKYSKDVKDNYNNDTLQGFYIKSENGKFEIEWKVLDFIVPLNGADTEEFSIWFWTKYIKCSDLDNDGLIDPIIVYGTKGNNNVDDGRIKILVYYKGQKRAIRHQNGTLDFERNTQIDKEFYSLPLEIQNHVKKLLVEIAEDNNGIFPAGYQEKMESKMTHIDEN